MIVWSHQIVLVHQRKILLDSLAPTSVQCSGSLTNRFYTTKNNITRCNILCQQSNDFTFCKYSTHTIDLRRLGIFYKSINPFNLTFDLVSLSSQGNVQFQQHIYHSLKNLWHIQDHQWWSLCCLVHRYQWSYRNLIHKKCSCCMASNLCDLEICLI